MFSVDNRADWNEADIANLKESSHGHDVFCANNQREIYAPHWHSDDEYRLIFNGICNFLVPLDSVLFQIKAEAGDLIWIRAEMIHWFNSSDRELLAARFFSTEKSHVMVTSGIPEAFTKLYMEFKNFKIHI